MYMYCIDMYIVDLHVQLVYTYMYMYSVQHKYMCMFLNI